MSRLDPSLRVAFAGCALLFIGTLSPWQSISAVGSQYATGADYFPGILVLGAAVGGGFLMYLSTQSGRRNLLAAVLFLALASLGICVSEFIQQQLLETDIDILGDELSAGAGESWGLWLSCIAAFIWLAAVHVHHRFPDSREDAADPADAP